MAMSDPTVAPLPPLPPRLPVVPLRGTVVFPLTLQPLGVNRAVSAGSAHRALGGDRLVLLVQQSGDDEDPGPDALRAVGVIGTIRQMAKTPAAIHVVVEGLVRARVTAATRIGDVLEAAAEPLPDDESSGLEVDAYVRRLRELGKVSHSLTSGPPRELTERIEQAQLPADVRKAADREVNRLEWMTPASPEHQMIRTYLEWLLEVDIQDLPEEVRADMTFVPVQTVDEVLALALPPSDAPPPVYSGEAVSDTPGPAGSEPAPSAAPEPDATSVRGTEATRP